ncbi:tripartite tricarboxylate transporter substrate-binding protein [Ramlibacter sp.]|uniref:Bug family tripartite tricarboxylate transporter substrate binding protein n=1 Tax=Ramlibacter sp. TaxID=1917967 RepID=UPI002633F330|nr:tripartite tricarboxylate transporter substrate-binding protein [Ramlibacter sp.]MDB5955869.1 tripartite tricarboxylate transporter substrate binding protein [Ramlibacter sp.]
MTTFLLKLAAAVVGASLIAPLASAQNAPYPSRPITLVVGFTPGGISDVLARALAARLTVQMGQTVIVDNRPGAATTVASTFVAHAPADGYTLYFQDMTSHAISAAAYKRLNFQPWNDFTMISLVATTPLMLVSSIASNATDVKTLIAKAKAAPQPLPYASSGNGAITHLAAESFKQLAGIDALHVPYKGGAPSTQALIGGEVAFSFSSMPPAIAQMKAGRLHGLAVTSAKRVPTAPGVPTLREAGIPMDLLLYSGILGPKGLPAAVVERIGAEVKKAVASPEMKKVLLDAGADAMTSTPAEFASRMQSEAASMAKAVQSAGVVLD